jgi:hypothetical protein
MVVAIGADDAPNARTSLSSQVSRAPWTNLLGVLFLESALYHTDKFDCLGETGW